MKSSHKLSGTHLKGILLENLDSKQKLGQINFSGLNNIDGSFKFIGNKSPHDFMETPDIPVKIIKNRFLLQDGIGQGGYGSVCKAIDKLTNKVVAIKFNKKIKNFKIECAVMEHLNKFKFAGKKSFCLNEYLGFPRLINYGVSEG